MNYSSKIRLINGFTEIGVEGRVIQIQEKEKLAD
jgi:hypothetical protein